MKNPIGVVFALFPFIFFTPPSVPFVVFTGRDDLRFTVSSSVTKMPLLLMFSFLPSSKNLNYGKETSL